MNETQRLAFLLRALGFGAIPLHGQLSQSARLGALGKFRARSRNILVATDVAARGLDIPSVDVVLNFDLPGGMYTLSFVMGVILLDSANVIMCYRLSQLCPPCRTYCPCRKEWSCYQLCRPV